MNETTTTTTEIDGTTEVTLESMGPGIVDYLDLGLKALLVIAAFAVAARL